MKIESKEQARTRGVPSPDRAEALMLALCRPPQKFEYYSLRNPPGSAQRPRRDPFHDDDYRSLRSSRFEAFGRGTLARYFSRHRGAF